MKADFFGYFVADPLAEVGEADALLVSFGAHY